MFYVIHSTVYREEFCKRDTVLVKKLLLEFLQFKHQVESKELKKMVEGGEDEEVWDVFDVSAHVQPKRRMVTLASDEGREPQNKVTDMVSRLEDGVVLSLGDEP